MAPPVAPPALEACWPGPADHATPVTALALGVCSGHGGVKIAAVAISQWTPDVYEGSPTAVVRVSFGGPRNSRLLGLALRLLVGLFRQLEPVDRCLVHRAGHPSAWTWQMWWRWLRTSMKAHAGLQLDRQAGCDDSGWLWNREGFAAMVL